jgi:hypothetical protein
VNRKLTVTYEIPEEICGVLERKAAVENRRLEELLAEYFARCQSPRHEVSPEEDARRAAAFEGHFGDCEADRQSSDNERIDADLAREYDSRG